MLSKDNDKRSDKSNWRCAKQNNTTYSKKCTVTTCPANSKTVDSGCVFTKIVKSEYTHVDLAWLHDKKRGEIKLAIEDFQQDALMAVSIRREVESKTHRCSVCKRPGQECADDILCLSNLSIMEETAKTKSFRKIAIHPNVESAWAVTKLVKDGKLKNQGWTMPILESRK